MLSKRVSALVWVSVSALSPVLSLCFRTCLVSFRASLCVGRRVCLVSGLVSLFPDLSCLLSCLPLCGATCPLVSGLVSLFPDLSCLLSCIPLCGTTCPPCLRSCRTCLVSFRASLCVGRRVCLVSGLVSLFPDLPCVLFIHLMFVQFAATFGLECYCGSFFFLGFALQPCLSLLHIALSINLQTWNLLVVTNYV